jgi:hypothetical protein
LRTACNFDKFRDPESIKEPDDFVHPGQDVEIKVDTFDFTRFGLLHGKVVNLSQDSIPREGDGRSVSATSQRENDGPIEQGPMAKWSCT